MLDPALPHADAHNIRFVYYLPFTNSRSFEYLGVSVRL